MLAGEERPERGERPEEWLVELLEELRSEEAEAWFRQDRPRGAPAGRDTPAWRSGASDSES